MMVGGELHSDGARVPARCVRHGAARCAGRGVPWRGGARAARVLDKGRQDSLEGAPEGRQEGE